MAEMGVPEHEIALFQDALHWLKYSALLLLCYRFAIGLLWPCYWFAIALQISLYAP
jgi:hypothetical protein